MKTKTIPFDLETAKKIQAGEIEGKIRTRDGRQMRIVCYDSAISYCNIAQPIIAQDIDNCQDLNAYSEKGVYILEGKESQEDLFLEIPDNEPQFKPFDKVLVRCNDASLWSTGFYSHELDGKHCVSGFYYKHCIPYKGNEQLVGTIKNPNEK